MQEETKGIDHLDASGTARNSSYKNGGKPADKKKSAADLSCQSINTDNPDRNRNVNQSSMQHIEESSRTNNTISYSQSREKTMITETTCSVSNEGGGIVHRPQRFDDEDLGLSQSASAAGQIS